MKKRKPLSSKNRLTKSIQSGGIGGLGTARRTRPTNYRKLKAGINEGQQMTKRKNLDDQSYRGVTGQVQRKVRDRFGTVDGGKRQMKNTLGKVLDEGTNYTERDIMRLAKSDLSKKVRFNRRQAEALGKIYIQYVQEGLRIKTEESDGTLYDSALTLIRRKLEEFNAQGANLEILQPDEFRKNIQTLVRYMEKNKDPFLPRNNERYNISTRLNKDTHVRRVNSYVHEEMIRIQKKLKQDVERRKANYLIRKMEENKEFPLLSEYVFIENLEFDKQILDRAKEIKSQGTMTGEGSIETRFKKEMEILGIQGPTQIQQYLSSCKPPLQYVRPKDLPGSKGLKYGKCIDMNTGKDKTTEVLINAITPWIFGEILNIFGEFQYVCENTEESLENMQDCEFRFENNIRELYKLNSEELGYDISELERINRGTYMEDLDDKYFTIGDKVRVVDISLGLDRYGIVISEELENTRPGYYKVAYLDMKARDALILQRERLKLRLDRLGNSPQNKEVRDKIIELNEKIEEMHDTGGNLILNRHGIPREFEVPSYMMTRQGSIGLDDKSVHKSGDSSVVGIRTGGNRTLDMTQKPILGAQYDAFTPAQKLVYVKKLKEYGGYISSDFSDVGVEKGRTDPTGKVLQYGSDGAPSKPNEDAAKLREQEERKAKALGLKPGPAQNQGGNVSNVPAVLTAKNAKARAASLVGPKLGTEAYASGDSPQQVLPPSTNLTFGDATQQAQMGYSDDTDQKAWASQGARNFIGKLQARQNRKDRSASGTATQALGLESSDQGGGAPHLQWLSGPPGPSQRKVTASEWFTNNENVTSDDTVIKQKNLVKKKLEVPKTELATSAGLTDYSKDKYGKQRYFLDNERKQYYLSKMQRAKDGFVLRNVKATAKNLKKAFNKFILNDPSDNILKRALNRREDVYRELCPEAFGCKLNKLMTIINPNLPYENELYDHIEFLKGEPNARDLLLAYAKSLNVSDIKIKEALISKQIPFSHMGKQYNDPKESLEALLKSGYENGGAQIITQEERMSHILAYLELRELPVRYFKLRRELQAIENSLEAQEKIEELQQKYPEYKVLYKLNTIKDDKKETKFPSETSLLSKLLKEGILYDILKKEENRDKNLDLVGLNTVDDVLLKIKEVQPKYKYIFGSYPENKKARDIKTAEVDLIPEFNRVKLQLVHKKDAIKLLKRVIYEEKDRPAKKMEQMENISISIKRFILDQFSDPSGENRESHLGQEGEWELSYDLVPIKSDINAILESCDDNPDDFLLEVPYTIVREYCETDYTDLWIKFKKDKQYENLENIHVGYRSEPGLDPKDRKYRYNLMKEVYESQNPQNLTDYSVVTDNKQRLYVKDEQTQIVLTKLIQMKKTEKQMVKLMRDNLLMSDDAEKEREKAEKKYIFERNIIRYDTFVKSINPGNNEIKNYIQELKPENISFTINNCDIEQFNGEYYCIMAGDKNTKYQKVNLSGDEYSYYVEKIKPGSGDYVYGVLKWKPNNWIDRNKKLFGSNYTKNYDLWVIYARKRLLNDDATDGQINYVYYWSPIFNTTNTDITTNQESIDSNYGTIINVHVQNTQGKLGENIISFKDSMESAEIPNKGITEKTVNEKSEKVSFTSFSSLQWFASPLGAKMFDVRYLGLDVGWPTYPYCATSKPIKQEMTMYDQFGAGSYNFLNGIITDLVVNGMDSILIETARNRFFDNKTARYSTWSGTASCIKRRDSVFAQYVISPEKILELAISDLDIRATQDITDITKNTIDLGDDGDLEATKLRGNTKWNKLNSLNLLLHPPDSVFGRMDPSEHGLVYNIVEGAAEGGVRGGATGAGIGASIGAIGTALTAGGDFGLTAGAGALGGLAIGAGAGAVQGIGEGVRKSTGSHTIDLNKTIKSLINYDTGENYNDNDLIRLKDELKEWNGSVVDDLEKGPVNVSITDLILTPELAFAMAIKNNKKKYSKSVREKFYEIWRRHLNESLEDRYLYAVNEFGAYDDRGTRILNNQISSKKTATDNEYMRNKFKPGFGQDSSKKVANYVGGIVPAFNRTDCEDGFKQLDENLIKMDKKEAIDWIMQPENMNSLVVIAKEMVRHDAAVGGVLVDQMFANRVSEKTPLSQFSLDEGFLFSDIYGDLITDVRNEAEKLSTLDDKYGRTGGVRFKSLKDPGSQFGIAFIARNEIKERIPKIEVEYVDPADATKIKTRKFTNVDIPLARQWNQKSYDSLLWYLDPNKTYYKKGEVPPEVFAVLEFREAGKAGADKWFRFRMDEEEKKATDERDAKEGKLNKLVDKGRGTNNSPFNDTSMLLSQRMAGESDIIRRTGSFVHRKISRADKSEAVQYLPGRRFLEAYFDKYPFYKYYKTNPETGNIDLMWTGNPEHGVWIDPRGQDQIALTMTPPVALLDPNSSTYKTNMRKFNHYGKIEAELREYEDKLITCWRDNNSQGPGCIDWNLKNNKDLVMATPFIDMNKGMFTMVFDYNDLDTVSQLGKNDPIDKKPTTGYHSFQLGPIINSHRSYITEKEDYAIIFFYEFDCDLLPYVTDDTGYDILRNYNSTAGWALISLKNDEYKGKILYYSYQPAYGINSKEGFYACSSNYLPPKENWFNVLRSQSNKYTYKIEDSLLTHLTSIITQSRRRGLHGIEQKDIIPFDDMSVRGGIINRIIPNYTSYRNYVITNETSGIENDNTLIYSEKNDLMVADSGVIYKPYSGQAFSDRIIIYRNTDIVLTRHRHEYLTKYINGICRISNPKATFGSDGGIDLQKSPSGVNYFTRSQECYSFTAWAFSKKLQIGATVRLDESVVRNPGRNILQHIEDISDDDEYMVIGYNGYWNSFGLSGLIGSPDIYQINSYALHYAKKYFLAFATLAATAIAISLGVGWLAGLFQSSSVALPVAGAAGGMGKVAAATTVAKMNAIQTAIYAATYPGAYAASMIPIYGALHAGGIASTSGLLQYIGGYLGTFGLAKGMLTTLAAGKGAVGTSVFAHSLINAGAGTFFSLLGFGGMKAAAAIAGAGVGGALGLGLGSIYDGSNYIKGKFSSKKPLINTDDKISASKNNFYSNAPRIPENGLISESDKIPYPIRVSQNYDPTDRENNKKKINIGNYLTYQTGDDTMPGRVVNGIEIYLQRIRDDKFVTLSVPFDKLDDRTGIYDIRKGNKGGTGNELQKSVALCKSKIEKKIKPFISLYILRKLFTEIDNNIKYKYNTEERYKQYISIFYGNTNINKNPFSISGGIDPKSFSEHNLKESEHEKNILSAQILNSVDYELYKIMNEMVNKKFKVLESDYLILIEILKALSAIIITNNYKKYSPEISKWVNKKNINESVIALKSIKDNEGITSFSNNRIKFHKYKNIIRTLYGYKGYVNDNQNDIISFIDNNINFNKQFKIILDSAQKTLANSRKTEDKDNYDKIKTASQLISDNISYHNNIKEHCDNKLYLLKYMEDLEQLIVYMFETVEFHLDIQSDKKVISSSEDEIADIIVDLTGKEQGDSQKFDSQTRVENSEITIIELINKFIEGSTQLISKSLEVKYIYALESLIEIIYNGKHHFSFGVLALKDIEYDPSDEYHVNKITHLIKTELIDTIDYARNIKVKDLFIDSKFCFDIYKLLYEMFTLKEDSEYDSWEDPMEGEKPNPNVYDQKTQTFLPFTKDKEYVKRWCMWKKQWNDISENPFINPRKCPLKSIMYGLYQILTGGIDEFIFTRNKLKFTIASKLIFMLSSIRPEVGDIDYAVSAINQQVFIYKNKSYRAHELLSQKINGNIDENSFSDWFTNKPTFNDYDNMREMIANSSNSILTVSNNQKLYNNMKNNLFDGNGKLLTIFENDPVVNMRIKDFEHFKKIGDNLLGELSYEDELKLYNYDKTYDEYLSYLEGELRKISDPEEREKMKKYFLEGRFYSRKVVSLPGQETVTLKPTMFAQTLASPSVMPGVVPPAPSLPGAPERSIYDRVPGRDQGGGAKTLKKQVHKKQLHNPMQVRTLQRNNRRNNRRNNVRNNKRLNARTLKR